jgi:hypothetical protein
LPKTETTTREGRAFIRRRLISPWPLWRWGTYSYASRHHVDYSHTIVE